MTSEALKSIAKKSSIPIPQRDRTFLCSIMKRERAERILILIAV